MFFARSRALFAATLVFLLPPLLTANAQQTLPPGRGGVDMSGVDMSGGGAGERVEVEGLETTITPSPHFYDVIIVGSEPEGVVAAVAAAEEGAKTLLVTRDPRVGGLFVMGEMNSLDLRTKPELYQRGLFLEWWRRVGLGHAFDVARAESAFGAMLAEAGVAVERDARDVQPLVNNGRVTGVAVDGETFGAKSVIDATADADLSAAAGAAYTVGFASLGLNERMADTLVFRIEGVDWSGLTRGVEARGKIYAEVDAHVAWGHFGGYPAAYEAQEPGLRLRGLNLGRQDDGSVLVNALLIYDIDFTDPVSVAEGYARAAREAPRVVDYLRKEIPGFARARFGGVAETLYIRDSRHVTTRCTLTTDDVFDNRVTNEDVAAGGYPLDVQTLTPHDNGYVYGTPEVYGARLCMNVPEGIDGLWVVGKAAGYDPLAASSARVVPFGMAVGEAVGVAAARAAALGVSPQDAADDPFFVAGVRSRLLGRGAYLPSLQARAPLGPATHPDYSSYRLLLSRGLALGGYGNDPKLDETVPALGYVYLLSNIGQRFLGDFELGKHLVSTYQVGSEPLTPDLALAVTHDAACKLGVCVERSWTALKARGLVPEDFFPAGTLTRGDMYALGAGLAQLTPPAETVNREP